MSDHRQTIRMEPLPPAFQAVYRRRGMEPPELSSRRDYAALWPYRLRRLHEIHAKRHGYFWLPCVLCTKPYGGHEIGDDIPDPTDETGRLWRGICPACAAERNGGKP